jgi:hypothetical protein
MKKLTNEFILQQLRAFYIRFGRAPKVIDINTKTFCFEFGTTTLEKRFGNLSKALTLAEVPYSWASPSSPLTLVCQQCGKKFIRPVHEIRRAEKLGRSTTACSRSCSNKLRPPRTQESRNKVSATNLARLEQIGFQRKEQIFRKSGKSYVKTLKEYTCTGCSIVFNSYQPRKTCSKQCARIRAKGSGGYRPGSGRSKSGHYKGFYCGSTYELGFLIYHLDKGSDIKRCTDTFTYEYKGKNHTYHPDFIINNIIYEIKGYYTEIVEIKQAAVVATRKPYKILYLADMAGIFDEVKSRYKVTELRFLYEDKTSVTRNCAFCGKEFLNIKPKVTHCSQSCSGKTAAKRRHG